MNKICTIAVITGYIVNQIRLECGFKKQADFGKLFDMTHAAIGKIERGEASANIEFLMMLGDAVGCRGSHILSIAEQLADHLVEVGVTFITHAPTSTVFESDTMFNSDDIEEIIPLDLKKAVRDLVKQKPKLNVKDAEIIAKEIDPVKDIASSASVMTIAAALGGPIGAGIGATLLASKFFMRNKSTKKSSD